MKFTWQDGIRARGALVRPAAWMLRVAATCAASVGLSLPALARSTEAGAAQGTTLNADRDVTAEGTLFVETSVDRPTSFLGERVELSIRFGVEQEFARANLLQRSSRRLDVPVQLEALEYDPVTSGTAPPSAREARTFVLNTSVARAARVEDRSVGGKTYQVYEVRRSRRAERAGSTTVPAPVLRFAFATRFREDLAAGAVPLDRTDAFVRGAALTLVVLPLPEEGRPLDFGGAVGRFELGAASSARTVRLGESFELTLFVRGHGNFGDFAAPRLADFERFDQRGINDEHSAERRTIVYDLAARDEKLLAIPSIAFSYYDPGPPSAYRTLRTIPIPLEVSPAAAPAPKPVDGRGAHTDLAPHDVEGGWSREPRPSAELRGGAASAAERTQDREDVPTSLRTMLGLGAIVCALMACLAVVLRRSR